jgi:ATP-dependent Lon protease
LRGKVLDIGGVKEKTLAAYRAGLREVIMPKGNEKDLRDVPTEVRQNMAFTFVATMDEVLRLALLPRPRAVARGSGRGRDVPDLGQAGSRGGGSSGGLADQLLA